MSHIKSRYRTHTCADLRQANVSQNVCLSGWIHRMRDHGGLVFVDLRDNYGLTQVVFSGGDAFERVQKLRNESVICIKGTVVQRGTGLVNTKIPTGEIEVHANFLEVLSVADVLPFQVAEDDGAPEPTRLKFRFLELRREKLHKNIVLRSQVIQSIRELMHAMGFLEFQTPILTSSSPEGARDFIVPSRIHPGKFFALPQAPQQFKQLLMVSGFDRYFQIAPCFRDEDARADRSPGEFYQLDLEMSFVEEEDVFGVFEELFHKLFMKFSEKEVSKPPFSRLRYEDAISAYGTDKPDLRIPFTIETVSEVFKETGFQVFKNALDQGGQVFAISIPLKEIPSRKYFDDTIEWFRAHSQLGLGYLIFDGAAPRGAIAKFISEAEAAALTSALKISGNTVVFFAAGKRAEILPHFGRLREKLGLDLKQIDDRKFNFVWITDYPMYERDPESGKIEFAHNPFSMPQGGAEALVTKDPLSIHAHQYDLVCNGYEILSGAIRNHEPEIMYKGFEIAGHSREQVDEKFGGMIRAFKFGAPPHGGGAPGIERIVMLLAGETAIRDVTAFPMTQNAEDLLMGAPSTVTQKQLNEVHIQLNLPKK